MSAFSQLGSPEKKQHTLGIALHLNLPTTQQNHPRYKTRRQA